MSFTSQNPKIVQLEAKISALVEEGEANNVPPLREAFNEWYSLALCRLEAHAKRRISREEEAIELLHDTLAETWERLLDQLGGSPTSMEYWAGTSLVGFVKTLFDGKARNEQAKKGRHHQGNEELRTGIHLNQRSKTAKSPSEPVFELHERHVRPTSPHEVNDPAQHALFKLDIDRHFGSKLVKISMERRLLFVFKHFSQPHTPAEMQCLAQAVGYLQADARRLANQLKIVLYDRSCGGSTLNKEFSNEELGKIFGVTRQTISIWLKQAEEVMGFL